jgi:putative endopeptidase
MLAAILSCGLAITSCNDVLNVIDNPTTTETEQASAKDPGKWWINESYMDKSVKPGDNFFMYCLGTWWKNTTVDPEKHYISRFSEMKPTFEERASSLTDDNYAKYKSHLKWADPNSEAATSAQELYDDALKQSGLLEATTSIDVLRAFGKMSAMGVGSCIKLEPFNYNNKICLFATLSGSDYVEEKANQANTTRSGRQPSIRQIINENPDVMDHLVPLCGRSGTRGISNSWSFIRHILDGMGVDSTQVYFYDDYIKAASTTPYPLADLAYALLKMWQTAFEDQTTGTTTLKALVMDYYRQDYGFISQKTMEEYNTYLNKSDDDTPPTTTKSLSLKKLELSLEREYLPYLRSKMVADQLVPPGLKGEYKKYCDEVKDVFAQRIKDNDWLSDGSKKNALEKLDAMVFNVAEPDEWYTEGLPDFTNSQSLLEDIYIMRKAYLNLMKILLGKSREEAAFTNIIVDPTSSLCIQNAFYDPNLNSMNMLPGYILPPFFDSEQSLAINYECFNTLGHEITHGFDTRGSRYDKYGTITADGIWASPADKAEFDRRTELLIKQFEAYDVLPDEMPGVKANGKTTIGENIADLGGMEIAWQAFLNRLEADGFTGDELKLMKQRFFLAYAEEYRYKYDAAYVNYLAFGKGNPNGADGHSMSKERVNGVVANMNGWYEAFDIKEGALYRKPADRIRIW